MILYILIFVCLCAYSLWDFKKGFLVFTALKVILYSGIALKVSSPNITFEFGANILFIALYIYNYYHRTPVDLFPYKRSFTWIAVSYFLSTFITLVPFTETLLGTIQLAINEYVFVYILWRVIETEKDIRFLVKSYLFIFLIVCVYGIIEKLIGFNPVLAYEIAVLGDNAEGKVFLSSSERLGMIRVQSFMPISISYGAYCAVFVGFFLYYTQQLRNIIKLNYITIVAFSLLLFSGVFFANSRSPMICCALAVLPAIRVQKLLSARNIIIFSAGVLVLLPYILPYLDNISSIFQKDSDVGGSSIAMRAMQFNVAINQFLESPIVGKGIRSIETFVIKEYEDEILGAESVWIKLMIERGLIGMISYILVYVDSYYMCQQPKNRKFYLLFSLAFITLSTMTSTPGLGLSFYMTLMIVICKSELVGTNVSAEYEQSENRQLNYAREN